MKRPIPQVSSQDNPAQAKFNQAVKENMEIMMGRRDGKLVALSETATLPEVIATINQIIERMQ